MAWLNPGGRTAAEFPLSVQGHGTIPAYLLHPQNQVADLIAKVAPALKAYLDKKRNDEIANEVMNMETPPRAEAVDPSLQGAPATAPTTGGADQFKARQMYQTILDKQQADQSQSTTEYWKNKVMEAQANRYQADAETPDSHLPRYPVTLPDGSTVYVTGNEAARYNRPTRGTTVKPDAWENMIPTARGEYDTTNNKFTGKNDGSYVQLQSPSGRTVYVPWASYQGHTQQQRFSGAKAFQDRQAQTTELPQPDLPALEQQQPSSAPELSQDDPYVVGKKYKDKNGNVATYLGNGKWQ
jgi:hypothetical protein